MMPDLGPYALEVGLSYAGSGFALLVIIAVSVVRARKVRQALEDAESRWARHG